jgi:hypothetical protein
MSARAMNAAGSTTTWDAEGAGPLGAGVVSEHHAPAQAGEGTRPKRRAGSGHRVAKIIERIWRRALRKPNP